MQLLEVTASRLVDIFHVLAESKVGELVSHRATVTELVVSEPNAASGVFPGGGVGGVSARCLAIVGAGAIPPIGAATTSPD